MRLSQKFSFLLLLSLSSLTISALSDEQHKTWTGPYVGLDAGYSWGSDKNTEFNSENGLPNGYTAKNNPSGGLVGINAGYNYLINDKWILGLMVEFKTYNANNTSEQCADACDGTKKMMINRC